MSADSLFGAEPKRLKKLAALGLESPDAEEAADSSPSAGLFVEKAGDWIGPYKLLRTLGEGGMGIVYLAEQHRPIRRQVAVKVIKPGMDSKTVIARFEVEKHALALMDYPHIARVHDAGLTVSGRPYFVMEHVDGVPITEYCDRYKLTIEKRLKLFLDVCEAVQHAHQKGIIHRDIKPSNILVSTRDHQAVPKIIDFGIAKALVQPLTEHTLVTELGQLFGTPEYMSPEQADMANEDIDTRSDVYSLGVLLYVLLTGVLPFDSETLREGGVEHIRQVIRETNPKTPSTRLTQLGDEARKVAEKRRTEEAALVKCLHRELEWIPLKAMRKERSERYRSASELADDIQNYLKGNPLLAGPESTAYLIRKFVKRKRALVMGIAAILIVLIAGIVISTVFAIGQARARTEAQLIADFLENDILGSVREARIGEATVSYILDAASKNLEGKFKERPLIEARISEKLGWTYRWIGESTKAEPHMLNAIRIYRRHLGEEHPDTLWAMDRLGWIYQDQARYHDMERLWTKSLQIRQRAGSVEDQIITLNALGVTNYHFGKYKDAESLYNKLLEIVQRELGEENVPFLPYYKCNLATAYWRQGRYEEAERLYIETLETAEWSEEYNKWWGLQWTRHLADMYREQGRYKEAEPMFVEILETQRLALGNKHRHTLASMYGLARLYTAQDRYEEAESLFTEMLEIAPTQLGEEHPDTLGFMNGFAVLLTKQKRYDEAGALFNKVLGGRRQKLDEDHPDTLESKHDLAMLHKEQGLYDKAEPLLIEALKGRRLKLGEAHPHTLESLNNLIDLYEAWKKPEKADKWRAKLARPDDAEKRD